MNIDTEINNIFSLNNETTEIYNLIIELNKKLGIDLNYKIDVDEHNTIVYYIIDNDEHRFYTKLDVINFLKNYQGGI